MADVYEELGVEPILNVATTFTSLGGSIMPREVLDAMQQAAAAFVDMHDLHLRAGAELARLTDNEAAYVTSGCAAAIVLSVLGARTGESPEAIARLIAGERFPDEVVMHAAHRIPYDPAVHLAGARIRTIGNVQQTAAWELEAAISDRTAAILYVAGRHMPPGALPLEEVVPVARSHHVPVIVDAAGQLPPVDNLWRFTRDLGADLALFSGGKALLGPQASGLMVGTERLVAAARAHGSPNQRLARAMKVGKEELGGLVAAVRRYVNLDHDAARRRWYATVEAWQQALGSLRGVTVTLEHHNEAGQPIPRLRLDIAPEQTGRTTAQIVGRLRSGRPRVEVLPSGGEAFWITPELVDAEEAQTVASAIIDAVGESSGRAP
jgi:uncharacterized pyridoxal phosphate-dependent enzyme